MYQQIQKFCFNIFTSAVPKTDGWSLSVDFFPMSACSHQVLFNKTTLSIREVQVQVLIFSSSFLILGYQPESVTMSLQI
jgi:hypothetical protein